MKLIKAKNLSWFKKNWLVLLVILAGAWLRFYNLNWDDGHFFHPDERNIAAAVSRISFFDQLNPKFFAYGSLPIYLYRLFGEVLASLTGNKDWVHDWAKINLIGRGFSAFFSTLAIYLSFHLTRKIASQKISLLAAFFVAFMPSLVQSAHFGVTESMLTFWILLLIILSLQIIKKPALKNYLWLGIGLGLALATKVSALSFLSVIGVAHFLGSPSFYGSSGEFFKKTLRHQARFLALILLAFTIFTLISPYTFLSWDKFKESMSYEGGIVSGRLRVVYVLQFEKTLPYLFQIKNLFWQMGPLASLGLLGITFLIYRGLKKKEKKILTFVSFPLAYFVFVGAWYAKFIRYLVPLLPFLAIAGAFLLDQSRKRWLKIGQILTFLTVLTSAFWGIAFFSVYTHESTRISASLWTYQNIPQGSKILQEHWDEGLPISVDGHHHSEYQTEQLTIYEPDNQTKTEYYAEKLASADYMIINSRRLYGTLIHLPERYPITSRYYQLLFNGNLGYQKVIQFTSYPSFLGVEINDDQSEETFQVYDHPKVIIFENKKRFSNEKIKKILSAS